MKSSTVPTKPNSTKPLPPQLPRIQAQQIVLVESIAFAVVAVLVSTVATRFQGVVQRDSLRGIKQVFSTQSGFNRCYLVFCFKDLLYFIQKGWIIFDLILHLILLILQLIPQAFQVIRGEAVLGMRSPGDSQSQKFEKWLTQNPPIGPFRILPCGNDKKLEENKLSSSDGSVDSSAQAAGVAF